MQPGILVEVPGRHEQRIHPECGVAAPERREVHVLTDCDADLVGPYRANHKFPSRREARLQPRYEMVLGVVSDELARRREQPGAILLMIALEQRHTGEQVDRIV